MTELEFFVKITLVYGTAFCEISRKLQYNIQKNSIFSSNLFNDI